MAMIINLDVMLARRRIWWNIRRMFLYL